MHIAFAEYSRIITRIIGKFFVVDAHEIAIGK